MMELEDEDSERSEFLSDAKRVAPYLAALLIAAGGFVFGVREHNTAQTAVAQRQALADENKQLTARLHEIENQPAALSPAASSPTSASQQAPAASSPTSAASNGRPAPGRLYDPHATPTRSDSNAAHAQFTSPIARTHDQLVLLEKKGELNYFEFDIATSKGFRHEGPVRISLKKADPKHGSADLALIVDNGNLTQKRVTLYQPAMFHQPGSTRPIEVVINHISKNHIHGYVSAPRYPKSDLAAASGNSAHSGPGSDRAAY